MTITTTMNDDIKCGAMLFRKCVNLHEPETICRCSLITFLCVVSGESDRRLLDVEVKNLCMIAGFPRSDYEVKGED